MKIVFMGTPEFSEIVLTKLNNKYPVGLIVTQPDKKVGRKQEIVPSGVKVFAAKNNIKVFQPTNLKTDYLPIIEYQPDIIITAAYGQILPSEIIDNFTCINIHGSLLPLRRGGAPVQRAIMEGELKTGVTIMYMAYKMDSGEIIDQQEITIQETDTTTILMEKLAYLGADLLLKHLDNIVNNKAPKIKQDESLVTFSYNLTKEDEIIDFKQSTFLVKRKINSLLDEPVASFFINNKRIKVYKVKKSDIIKSAKCGEILSIDKALTIKTKDGAIDILELQEQGKNKMLVKDYLNGQRLIKKGDIVSEKETSVLS